MFDLKNLLFSLLELEEVFLFDVFTAEYLLETEAHSSWNRKI